MRLKDSMTSKSDYIHLKSKYLYRAINQKYTLGSGKPRAEDSRDLETLFLHVIPIILH